MATSEQPEANLVCRDNEKLEQNELLWDGQTKIENISLFWRPVMYELLYST